MTRVEDRQSLRSAVVSFRKTPDVTMETDAFDDLGIHCHFSPQDTITYVECHNAFGEVAVFEWSASI